jgi:methionyl-tRNA formyltransferase
MSYHSKLRKGDVKVRMMRTTKNFLLDLQPHLRITAAYGQYLHKKFLAIPTLGKLNIHPSLLPRWRGASPVQRSLQAGDNPIGVSVLFTVSNMDAGPIVSQSVVHIHPDEDASTLLPHLFQIGTQKLLTVLPQVLSGHINMDTATQQDESKVVHAAIIDSSEGQLRVWEESAVEPLRIQEGLTSPLLVKYLIRKTAQL